MALRDPAPYRAKFCVLVTASQAVEVGCFEFNSRGSACEVPARQTSLCSLSAGSAYLPGSSLPKVTLQARAADRGFSGCEDIYCQGCIADCLLCPECRDPLKPGTVKTLSEVNKMGMRLMQGLAVRCPYRVDAGRESIWDDAVETPCCEITIRSNYFRRNGN